MTQRRHIAVIDIGKTNVKLALVDAQKLTEIAVVTRPNTVHKGPPWPHFDTAGHWAFFLASLKQFQHSHGIDGISVTTHGASIVLLDTSGALAAPILDYEHSGPDKTAVAYNTLRPVFSATGSPRLAHGLNVGAQLHWQFETYPTLKERTAHILTYPQYWGHRLTGKIASDVTSIGCHTDLWEPQTGQFSDLVNSLGIREKMAPVRRSTDTLGTLLPEIAKATGLSQATPVVCGIHDSNASLYPHITTSGDSLSVVSTGTWVIAMALNGATPILDPDRDTLINVNALGDPVPSARFMGGREFELIQQGHPVSATQKDVDEVFASETMLLPAVDPASGPFQGRKMDWRGATPALGTPQRSVALSFYLALMTNTCLKLIGATGPTVVEGPFAANTHYLAMLQSATGRPVHASTSATGTSIGAALLFDTTTRPAQPRAIPDVENVDRYARYARKWDQLTSANQ